LTKITKDEAINLRKRYPNVYIVTVGRNAPARKKTRFVEETYKVKRFLEDYRAKQMKGAVFYGK
jgi:hypothetical protein